jgi:Cysteine rich repeat
MKSPLLVGLGLSMLVTAAMAAEQSPNVNRRAACKADVENLCSGVQRGGGRIAACLKQNETQVSQACKDAVASAHQQKKAPQPGSPQG